jgi:hypothetical protein
MPAMVGYYVPQSGSTIATSVDPGFYTTTAGAITEIPGGGMAASLVASVQASSMMNTMALNVLDSPSQDLLRVEAAYQRLSADQLGLRSGRFNTDLSGISLASDFYRTEDVRSGAVVSLTHHHLSNNTDVTNSGDGYQVGLFSSFYLGSLQSQAILLYGSTTTNNQRNITASYYNNSSGTTVTNVESLSSNPNIHWYGVESRFHYPVLKDLGLVAELGVLSYQVGGTSESALVTSTGSSNSSIAALSVSGKTFVSIPASVSLGFDLIPKKEGSIQAPVVLSVGAFGNGSGTQSLKVSSTSNSAVNFDLPVKQTAVSGAMTKLAINDWALMSGWSLGGVIQLQAGSGYSAYSAALNLKLKW